MDETLAAARGRPVEPVLPKVTVRDGVAQVLMPGAGYATPSSATEAGVPCFWGQ